MIPTEELALRRALGIPDDAEQVLILAESSHWDPNWLYTAEEYYHRFVERNLDQSLEALEKEPRRVYSVECVFFLRMFWERRPKLQGRIRQLVNAGRLRLTSSGVTTADTLLPGVEAILRDFLYGQEWLRQNGMTAEPRVAYFSDSFGCTPALPSLLRAAGFDRTAITRIDGMFFPGCDLEPARHFPRPGSSAARLLQEDKSLDLIWRDANGAEVLAHWNAFTYAQGDLLAHRGISRVYLFPLAFPARAEGHVARRIAQYVQQLEPYSRTPYLFCPIGFDFVEPIPDLVALLDRYNRLRYPSTGTWVLNAGLDDYLALIDHHRAALPVVALDPNPYWTGFYTARPALKHRCHELVERLLRAEMLALAPENCPTGPALLQELEPAWWIAATANHHDFITGTSPDAVVENEQIPWLERATVATDSVLQRLAPVAAPEPPAPSAAPNRFAGKGRFTWTERDGRLHVESPHYAVELSTESGGSIAHMWGPEGNLYLASPAHSLCSYRDTGGLWRMGHEFRGGTLRPMPVAQQQLSPSQVRDLDGELEVTSEVILDGEPVRRTLWFRCDSPVIRGRVQGRAAPGRTVTLLFQTIGLHAPLVMAQPGGVIERPLERIYAPTFWPVQEFAHLRFPDGRGLAFFIRESGAVAGRPDGCVEWVVLRNATRERAYRFIPLPANPATGHEREPYVFDYAFLLTAAGDWRTNDLWSVARHLRREHWMEGPVAAAPVSVDPPAAVVLAVKPASRGSGIIIRLYAPAPPAGAVTIALRERVIRFAHLCDARERDLEPLPVVEGRVSLQMPGAVATVRVSDRE